MLYYYTQEEKERVYGARSTELRGADLCSFREWIIATAIQYGIDKTPATVSTELPRKSIFQLRREQVMVLDCDDTQSMIAAVASLKHRNIGWAGIESSPGRYWLITDLVGHFHTIFPIIRAIPGVDKRYIRHCWKYSRFSLRAIRRTTAKPQFGETSDLKDDRVIAWLKAFEMLHDDAYILYHLNLIQNLYAGTIDRLVSNPNFDV